MLLLDDFVTTNCSVTLSVSSDEGDDHHERQVAVPRPPQFCGSVSIREQERRPMIKLIMISDEVGAKRRTYAWRQPSESH